MLEPRLLLSVHGLTIRPPASRFRSGGAVTGPARRAVPAPAASKALDPLPDAGERAQPVLELDGERVGLGQALLLEHGQAILAQARLRQRGELTGHDASGAERLPGGHEPVDEADPLRLLGADRATGEDHVKRAATADQPRQPHRAPVDQRNAEAPAEDAEHGPALGDPQIAPQRKLQSARDRVAGDRRDHGLGEPHPRRSHRPVAVTRDAVSVRAADGVQVGARAEGAARAPEHRNRRPPVGVERAERIGQRGRGRTVDGVASLRAGEDDRRHRPVALDTDRHGAHREPPAGLGPGAAGPVAGAVPGPGAAPTARRTNARSAETTASCAGALPDGASGPTSAAPHPPTTAAAVNSTSSGGISPAAIAPRSDSATKRVYRARWASRSTSTRGSTGSASSAQARRGLRRARRANVASTSSRRATTAASDPRASPAASIARSSREHTARNTSTNRSCLESKCR